MNKNAGSANLSSTALFKQRSESEQLLSALFQPALSFSAERGEVWNKLNENGFHLWLLPSSEEPF